MGAGTVYNTTSSASSITLNKPASIAAGDVLIAGQKSGEVHALDPETGKLLWQRKLGRGGIQGGVLVGMSVVGETVFVPISDFFGGPRWPGEG